MPKKRNLSFRHIKKYCLLCGNELTLNNMRDVERKKFCCRSCTTIYYKPHKGHKHSEQAKDKISIARKSEGRWKGKGNPNYNGIITTGRIAKENERRLHRIRMLNGDAAKARKACGGKISSIELIVQEYLSYVGIEFIEQKIINNHAVDIFINPDIIIECDGKYWHSLPIQKERDKKFLATQKKRLI